ncbi:LOW QUALITY PROTEIN: tripartite motif-containing protein 42 [Porphyrio hochstetteri]
MDENGHPCSIWPCCSNCCCLTCHSKKEERCLCWRFLFTSEQNCSCFPCLCKDDKSCCCHCSCAEHTHCWRCCSSNSNDPDCKCCCCCSGENSPCYYESKCCRNSVNEPYHSRTPGTVQSKDVKSIFISRKDTSVITLEMNVSSHTFLDQLACPLKQLFLQLLMLPCNHCISEKDVTTTKTKAEVTEDFYIIICPVCCKVHCLSYTNQLRKNYLRAKLAKKNAQTWLRWRFDHSEKTVFCEACKERRRVVTKRCRCQINYCNELYLNHSKNCAQDHIFTTAHQDDTEWHCLLHSNSNFSEYCLDDHELIRDFCKNSLHNDHETIPSAVPCSREAALDTIAKFRKGLQGVDYDLMEVTLLKNNFKTCKDTKREIRNGFLKLHMVLHEQEKEMMELLENIELKKQKEISEYINYTSSQLSHTDGLSQYSKEALEEERQVVFLQSAHCLVKGIENAVPSFFQPNPHLKEDPLRKLQLNFDELLSVLQGLVPSLSRMQQPESMLSEATARRPSSTPPHHPTQRNEVCAYQDTASETPRKERKHQIVNFSSPEPTDDESIPLPGPVVIHQTVVYSRSAKIYWTCPSEDRDFFEVVCYEVADISPDNIVQVQLAGNKIQQQNLEIHNLHPNTECLSKVCAVNTSGQGE